MNNYPKDISVVIPLYNEEESLPELVAWMKKNPARMGHPGVGSTGHLATALLAQAGIEPAAALRALEPLCREALDNVLANGARSALTGPVARGDATTVAMHMDGLADARPTVSALYQAVARHLVEIAKERGLTDLKTRALESALDATGIGPAKAGHYR